MTQLSKAQMYDALAGGGVKGELARIMAGGSHAEGGWDTEVQGDVQADGTVCSWGLFQINRCGGLGVGYSEAELRDPAVQVAIMRPVYEAQYDRYQADGWTGAELAVRVCLAAERPFGWMDPTGPAAQGYRRGYEAAAPDQEAPPMTYNADQPTELQVQPWSCSIRTATWMLKSIGVDTDAGRMQAVMVPDYVTPELGLLQGDGSGLADVLAAQSGCATGHAWVDWPWLLAHAGTQPIGLGGVAWNHWVGVRRVTDRGTLTLANPAPSWMGVNTELTEADMARLGPFAAVWIDVPEEDQLSAEERTELQRYRDEQPYYATLLGTPDNPGGLIGSALGTMEQAAGTSKTALAKVVREQCASVRQAAGL